MHEEGMVVERPEGEELGRFGCSKEREDRGGRRSPPAWGARACSDGKCVVVLMRLRPRDWTSFLAWAESKDRTLAIKALAIRGGGAAADNSSAIVSERQARNGIIHPRRRN